jgi:NAD-dependent dihydropyrimidine dehydrogenase PreA subunit
LCFPLNVLGPYDIHQCFVIVSFLWHIYASPTHATMMLAINATDCLICDTCMFVCADWSDVQGDEA